MKKGIGYREQFIQGFLWAYGDSVASGDDKGGCQIMFHLAHFLYGIDAIEDDVLKKVVKAFKNISWTTKKDGDVNKVADFLKECKPIISKADELCWTDHD